MNKAYLLIGGNMGDRILYINEAVKLISDTTGNIVASSAIYETAAWGTSGQAAYLNQALLVETSLSADNLMTRLLDIEKKIGRVRTEKYAARTIDIDILLFNNEVHNTLHITIPHPQLPNRKFALILLSEIAAGYIHPVLHRSIAELLEDCVDELDVKKF